MTPSFVHFLDIFGVAVFAIAGTLTAIEKRFDLFGVIVVALITALGGGTLRDVTLDAHPVIWIADTGYLSTGILAAVATFVVVRFVKVPLRAIEICDAVGLAFFVIAGIQKATNLGHQPEIALLMGLMTGVAGGILRDVLCNEVPLIFHREIYATAALSGGFLYLALLESGLPPEAAMVPAMLTIIVLRLCAVFFGLSLPQFLFSKSRD
ncbi:trimeric intracellular cation channel family protein [Granulosicoccaceae sp. 1_MG-2023]|nr:trimeric intracellular cation channel family protein [Granulosicoccaceae sp. 1_MG-2023]